MVMLALSACNKDKPTNTQTSDATQTTQIQASAPAQERKEEHYAVGSDPSSPPFILRDEHGLVVGFDIDILQAIADDQNFSLAVFPTEHAQLFSDLASNKYQILASNLAATPERQSEYSVSKPYTFVPNVIMGKEGNTAKTLADIGEQKLAVERNSLMHEVAKKANVKNIVTKDSLYAAYGAFVRGEADYVIGDAGVLSHHHLNSGVADTVKVYTSVYDNNDENAYVAYVMQKDNTALLDKINTGLANIRANGKYDEIYKKWFGDDQSLKVPADKLWF